MLRDDRFDLVTLSALARTFDQISKESGRDWPAVDAHRAVEGDEAAA